MDAAVRQLQAPPRIQVAGFSGCPFFTAAEGVVRKVEAKVPGSVGGQLEVVALADPVSFRNWAEERGCPAGTSSPACLVDDVHIGGYIQLRAWLANHVASLRIAADRANSDSAPRMVPCVQVLTLKKHLAGAWLVDLKLALLLAGADMQVSCVDAATSNECIWGTGGLGAQLSRCADPLCWHALLNLVSDTAEPALQRRLWATMSLAESAGIWVANGIKSMTTCASKVTQHALLRRAGLPSPRSIAVSKAAGIELAALASQAGLHYPLLLKPNAGGFGDGITCFKTRLELHDTPVDAARLRSAFGDDGLALLQEKIASRNGLVGRIWILGGKVLCAVKAQMMLVGANGAESASGCMSDGGAAIRAQPWSPPDEIVKEVMHLGELAGSSWGSVELLFPENDDGVDRLYYDLNLSCISSLPDPSLVPDPEQLWPEGFDPYGEMAEYILKQITLAQQRVSC